MSYKNMLAIKNSRGKNGNNAQSSFSATLKEYFLIVFEDPIEEGGQVAGDRCTADQVFFNYKHVKENS